MQTLKKYDFKLKYEDDILTAIAKGLDGENWSTRRIVDIDELRRHCFNSGMTGVTCGEIRTVLERNGIRVESFGSAEGIVQSFASLDNLQIEVETRLNLDSPKWVR